MTLAARSCGHGRKRAGAERRAVADTGEGRRRCCNRSRRGQGRRARRQSFSRWRRATEEKISADKTKLVKAAGKVHVISRAEAAPLAALTPNQIIAARGFWQGLPDGMTAAHSAVAKNPLAALSSRGTGADPETTGSISPLATLPADRMPPEGALAYAEPGTQEAASNAAPLAGLTTPRVTVMRAVAVQTGNNEMTVAVKRIGGRPASAILTVADKLTPAPSDSERLNDPWLRAIVLSPSVTQFLSISMLGARDFGFLAALMAKPANSVMMTFAADPQLGLSQDRFSGSAIVFVSTVTYPIRTADLR